MKELYIYSGIYNFTAQAFNERLNQVSNDDKLLVRINSNGGEVSAGFSMLSKLQERTGETNAIIDGGAKSMAAYMLPFFDKVTSNDTSELMFHKAAYPSWIEPTNEQQQSLKRTNELFETKMRAKVQGKPGAEQFLAKLFEADVRNDVELTPQEAQQLGLVDEVRTLEPKAFETTEMVALFENGKEIAKEESTRKQADNINKNNKNMNIQELKSEHPALYSEIFELGKTAGVGQEKDRAESWSVFAEIDADAVKAGIESGEPISQKQMAEFTKKAAMKELTASHNDDNTGDAATGDAKTAEEVKKEAEAKELDEALSKYSKN